MTTKTLFAFGRSLSDISNVVVRFQSDRPDESTVIGHVEASYGCRTAFFKGQIFVIGGSQSDIHGRVYVCDVNTGSTDQVASLLFDRCGHSVTTSLDEVFVCGGKDMADMVTCEAFNPHTKQWRRLPDMLESRNCLAVACLPDGRLVATGGIDGFSLSSCEMLQPASQSAAWQRVAGMRLARYQHAATCFESRIFVVGGLELTTSEVFTPPPLDSSADEMGQWTSIRSNMTRAFSFTKSVVVVSDNEIIAFGFGQNEVERFCKNPTSSAEGDNFEGWMWAPLPAIRHLDSYINGVHSAN